MKIHAFVAVCVLIINFVLQLQPYEWLAIMFCIVLVFSLECMNTAVESAVDFAGTDKSELAKHAKDCAAGAVLLAGIGSVVIGLYIYVPALIELLS